MTDNQLEQLLGLFQKIEVLLVQNGASTHKNDGAPSSFSDKVKSFDNFESEPSNPGDIGYKFYLDKEDMEYYAKPDYEYDTDIEIELENYSDYKTWKKRYWEYRNSILGGNYYTLKKIGHERNQLMHIYGYKIENLNKFIKVCYSMISYLQNPNKIKFFGYGKFKETNNVIFDDIIKSDEPIRLSFSQRSKWIMFDKVLDTFWSTRAFFVIFITLGILIGIDVILNYKLSIRDNLLLGVGLQVIFYHIVPIYGLIDNFFTIIFSALEWIFSPVTFLFTKLYQVTSYLVKTFLMMISGGFLLLEFILNLLPFFFVVWVVYYIWLAPKNDRSISMAKQSVTTKNSIKNTNQSCLYYYVKSKTLNVRAHNSSKSHVVSKVHRNDKLCIVKKNIPWYYINNKGWVYGQYIYRRK